MSLKKEDVCNYIGRFITHNHSEIGVWMSNCKRIKAIVSEYIEQDLTREQQRMVEAHLSDCKTCDEVIERVKDLRTKLHTLAQLKTSEDFETILRTRIRIESGLSRRRLSEILWTGPAKLPVYGMAVALIVIASIMVFDQVKQSRRPAQPAAYINTEFYDGNSQQNQRTSTMNASDDVIYYAIDKVTPDEVASKNETKVGLADSTHRARRDSVSISRAPVQRVNQKTF